MAEYIDRAKLIAEYDRVHIGPAGGARKLMVDAPACDVAPRSEIAKEIFAEIEFDIHQLMFERDEHRAIAIEGVIANLKKKYTEDLNNG